MKKIIIIILVICMFPVFAAEKANIPDVKGQQQFINEMITKYHFSKNYISDLISHAHFLPQVIEHMKKPYEEKPWYIYRNHFYTKNRINKGVKYWKSHAKNISLAQKEYGVPANIIVAIVGVESTYGERTGDYSVLDTLFTLSFYYPRRSKFFRSELEQYLLLLQELPFKAKATALKGSYAGAMGLPQFMPSSYRYYAVDFNKNRHKDLLHDTSDVIGSVANYLMQNGWDRDQKQIAVPAKVVGNKYKIVLNDSLKAKYTVAELKKYGVKPKYFLPGKTKVNIIRLKSKRGYEFWLGLNNFYVITRYNTSTHYAMIVYQISQAIYKAKHRKGIIT